jgi:hypothetical protein
MSEEGDSCHLLVTGFDGAVIPHPMHQRPEVGDTAHDERVDSGLERQELLASTLLLLG